MNILIIENETYLSQKIILRLQEDNHNCTSIYSIDELDSEIKYDVILLSTGYEKKVITKVLKLHPSTIIIFLGDCNKVFYLKYIKDFKLHDYISKPFVMDQLIRMINHYITYEYLVSNNKSLDFYCNNILKKDIKESSTCFNLSSNLYFLLSIDDYLKQIIHTFQHILTDVELSKKLGISRKTLWAKRKKLKVL